MWELIKWGADLRQTFKWTDGRPVNAAVAACFSGDGKMLEIMLLAGFSANDGFRGPWTQGDEPLLKLAMPSRRGESVGGAEL
jgi:hypothetical protein